MNAVIEGRNEHGEGCRLIEYKDGVARIAPEVSPAHALAALEALPVDRRPQTTFAPMLEFCQAEAARDTPKAALLRAELRQLRLDAIAAYAEYDMERVSARVSAAYALGLLPAKGAWPVRGPVDATHTHGGKSYFCTVFEEIRWTIGREDAASAVTLDTGRRCWADLGELDDRNLIAA